MHKSNKITEVKLFISSTFQDMQEERNYLMTQITPRLRELCATYGLNFFCYDLRWGITTEMQEKQGTLHSCLSAVENSKPFFVGILGERYGWIPEDKEVLAAFGEEGKGKSITELEILSGVTAINEGFCCFYLRDRVASGEFIETDPKRIQALDALKDFIRSSKYPCYENYVTAEEFGEQLYQDFAKWLKETFDPGSNIEKNKQKAYANALSRVACGNSEIEDNIFAWIKEPRPLYIRTEGEMLSAILNTNPRFTKNENFDLISVNLAASLFLRTSYEVMYYILNEASALYPNKIMFPNLPALFLAPSAEEKVMLQVAFRTFCENATPDRPILLLITNPELFAAQDDKMFTWLPSVLGEYVRVIVVSNEDECVAFLNARDWHTRRIIFDKANNIFFLNEYFARMGKRLSQQQSELLFKQSTLMDDYDTAMLLAESLTKGTVFDELDEKLNDIVLASQRGIPTVAAIEELFITKLTIKEQDIYYKTFPFLVESGFSIREEELYEAICMEVDCPLMTWHKVQAKASAILPLINGTIVITNKAIRKHMTTSAYLLNNTISRLRVMDIFTTIYHRRYLHALDNDMCHRKCYTMEVAKKYLRYQSYSSQKKNFQDFFINYKQLTAALIRNDPTFFRFIMFVTSDTIDWINQYLENESLLVHTLSHDFETEEAKRLFERLVQTMKYFDTADKLRKWTTIEYSMRYNNCSQDFLNCYFEMSDSLNEIDSQEKLDEWYNRINIIFANVKDPYECCAFYFLMANYANKYSQPPFKLRMSKLLVYFSCKTHNDFTLSLGIYYMAKAYLAYGEEGADAAANLFALSERYSRSIGDFRVHKIASIFTERMNK